MRGNDRRKAFTIVELVIVIAVIAILAAVLIPTFAGILKKANLSADMQLAKHMTKTLQTASQFETPDDVIDVSAMLVEEGIGKDAVSQPTIEEHKFYWHSKHNVIVMILEKEGEEPVLVYPDDNEQLKTDLSSDMEAGILFNLLDGYEYTVKKVSTTDGLKAAMADKTKIVLTANIELTDSVQCVDNTTVILDLKGHTLSSANIAIESKTGAVLTVKNGSTDGVRLNALDSGSLNLKEVNAKNTYWCNIENNGGIIAVEDSTVYSTESAIYNNAGTLTLSNTKIDAALIGIVNSGTVTVNNSTVASYMTEAPEAVAILNEGGSVAVTYSELKSPSGCLINRKGTVDIIGSSLVSTGVCILNKETLTISGSTVTSKSGCICNLEGGNAEIIKGTYACNTDAAVLENADGASLRLKGGVQIFTKSSTPIIGEISGNDTDYSIAYILDKVYISDEYNS